MPESTKKHLIGILVRVPDEFAKELCELDLVVIQGANRPLGPEFGEFGEEVLQVERAG